MIIAPNDTSFIAHVLINSSTSDLGGGLTGLTNNSTGLEISVARAGDSTPTVYTQASSNIETITTLGTYQAPSSGKIRFKEFNAANMPGVYELHFDNALWNTSARFLHGIIQGPGALNIVPCPFRIRINAMAADIYHADIDWTRDTASDEFTVRWFKNGIRVTSGITSPTIQVVKRVDGTDLIASTAMSEIGSSGAYKYSSGSLLTSKGEAILIVASATIGGASRVWDRVLSRDA